MFLKKINFFIFLDYFNIYIYIKNNFLKIKNINLIYIFIKNILKIIIIIYLNAKKKIVGDLLPITTVN